MYVEFLTHAQDEGGIFCKRDLELIFQLLAVWWPEEWFRAWSRWFSKPAQKQNHYYPLA